MVHNYDINFDGVYMPDKSLLYLNKTAKLTQLGDVLKDVEKEELYGWR